MMNRKLNSKGSSEFKSFVEHLRAGEFRNTPMHLLDSDETSELLDFEIDFDDREFSSRYEFGLYLVDKLKHIEPHTLISDYNFWTTIALIWFDQLCPAGQDGTRKPSMVYNYILSNDYRHRPRHAVFTTWQLVEQYGEDAMFLLSKEMPIRGELIEQIMGRQNYVSREGVIRAASRLYTDTENRTFKKGAAARTSPGCVARYAAWLNQIDLNYDLFEMNADQLIAIMPKEFERFSAQAE